jgi:hypothetical protein
MLQHCDGRGNAVLAVASGGGMGRIPSPGVGRAAGLNRSGVVFTKN